MEGFGSRSSEVSDERGLSETERRRALITVLAINPALPHILYAAPVLHPLIYRLRDSRCSGQSKQRGSWREGSSDPLQSAIMWLPAGLKTRRHLSWYAKPV